MTGHGAKFGRKKDQAIVALLTHRTTEEAARAIGISGVTLLRWQKEPEFQASYQEAKRAAYANALPRGRVAESIEVDTFVEGNQSALVVTRVSAEGTTLGKIMLDTATPPATRVRAADSILDHTTKAIETEDIEARVSELERAVEHVKPGRSK